VFVFFGERGLFVTCDDEAVTEEKGTERRKLYYSKKPDASD
jgi:hypothetical protein